MNNGLTNWTPIGDVHASMPAKEMAKFEAAFMNAMNQHSLSMNVNGESFRVGCDDFQYMMEKYSPAVLLGELIKRVNEALKNTGSMSHIDVVEEDVPNTFEKQLRFKVMTKSFVDRETGKPLVEQEEEKLEEVSLERPLRKLFLD